MFTKELWSQVSSTTNERLTQTSFSSKQKKDIKIKLAKTGPGGKPWSPFHKQGTLTKCQCNSIVHYYAGKFEPI